MIKKEELKKMTNEELLELCEKAKGNTKEFPKIVEADFSYTVLTNEILSRGGKNGYYFGNPLGEEGNSRQNETIEMKKNKESCRQSYMINKEVAEKWRAFNQNITCKSVVMDAALLQFMDDVKSGKIKLVITFD